MVKACFSRAISEKTLITSVNSDGLARPASLSPISLGVVMGKRAAREHRCSAEHWETRRFIICNRATKHWHKYTGTKV